ncbi:MAG: hypothetical protein IT473_16225 [Lysobacter sp.]|nr:hypothetical protein [Lysobacter sp.]
MTSYSGEPQQFFWTHRAAGRTPAVFRFAKDGESKNPDSDSVVGLLCRGKVFSFAYFSLTRAILALALRAA